MITVKMSKNLVLLLFIYFTYDKFAQSKDIEDIAACLNGTDCNDLEQSEVYTENTVKSKDTILNEPFNVSIIPDIDSTTSLTKTTGTLISENETDITTVSSSEVSSVSPNEEYGKHTVQKMQSDICECDMTVFSCDINCCCDTDCLESHVSVFSGCKDFHAELYDSRYCYHRNFIERNNTPFILEKLANNLFCILYDNLPPTYSTNNDLVINNRQDLDAIINSNKIKWLFKYQPNLLEYNTAKPYQDGDFILKLQGNYIQSLDLLQTGFTGLCSFKKTLQYLRNWKGSCIQSNLTNENVHLYTETFNNFSVISSPHLFNRSYILNEVCPRNVCLSAVSYYCRNLWTSCNKTASVPGFCSNRTCQNIVRGVKYVIVHNGSLGINNVSIYFDIGNVSYNFYQHFEVTYEWVDLEKEKVFFLSGNPGYVHGKPILTGRLKVNKTSNSESQHIVFNKSDCFFTLPLTDRNGECSFTKRHLLAFGEDVKLKCRLFVKTNNFSTSSCIELQNQAMQLLMNDSFINITQKNLYNVFISKLGNITDNDTSGWVQVLLDKVPQNVVTGQLMNGQLHCSGLITSMQINILYSTLSKPETLTNNKILGFGITLSDDVDISWPKCMARNCTDILQMDITTYVTFHDISKPSKHYFVGAPNLDLTLPYDFFYPFLRNSAGCIEHKLIAVSGVMYSIFSKVIWKIAYS